MTTQHIRSPGPLTRADTSALCAPGEQWTNQKTWKRYRYVYNSGATSWTIGVPVGVFLTADYIWECSFTAATQLLFQDGGTDSTAVAGIALGTIATTEWGWIQVGGMCDYVVTDGNVTASDGLYVADNGVVALPVTEPTHGGSFGIAVDADNASSICTKVLLTKCVLDF